jgi:pyruvate-ferredoxin/flavodoxin oxidoreductase
LFGDSKIRKHYTLSKTDFVECIQKVYLKKYSIIDTLVEGGIVFLNFLSDEDIPDALKKVLAKKKSRLFVVNASKIARDC